LKGVDSGVFENILSTLVWKEWRKERNGCQIANKSEQNSKLVPLPPYKLAHWRTSALMAVILLLP
jgi:hypothetical protein